MSRQTVALRTVEIKQPTLDHPVRSRRQQQRRNPNSSSLLSRQTRVERQLTQLHLSVDSSQQQERRLGQHQGAIEQSLWLSRVSFLKCEDFRLPAIVHTVFSSATCLQVDTCIRGVRLNRSQLTVARVGGYEWAVMNKSGPYGAPPAAMPGGPPTEAVPPAYPSLPVEPPPPYTAYASGTPAYNPQFPQTPLTQVPQFGAAPASTYPAPQATINDTVTPGSMGAGLSCSCNRQGRPCRLTEMLTSRLLVSAGATSPAIAADGSRRLATGDKNGGPRIRCTQASSLKGDPFFSV
ncbi:hypothetical protein BIW11_04088 [Tropilaelaps mercedesae]|uniref:Uncharacterized protein n=1 Tax=Tropilaelaps mercedesae TaxID=418985 RepID=A0A1V9XBC1_9ACAR|nr:hypothetical protein BIW11_04088 [Tropilaelaps mercedesae]